MEKKECYNCGEMRIDIEEGREVESGVFVCFQCQIEDDQIATEDLDDQRNRGII